VVGIHNNSYKPIINTTWVRARLCNLPVVCPWLVVLSGYSGFFHD